MKTKIGDLIYYLIVRMRNIVEKKISEGGDLMAQGEEILFPSFLVKSIFGNRCALCWRPIGAPVKAGMVESYLLGTGPFFQME